MPSLFYTRPMGLAVEFDTHRFVKRLVGSGFTEVQAETLADEHVALLNSNLATKVDMAEVNARIEATKVEIAEAKAEIAEVNARIEATKAELRVEIEKVRGEIEKVRGEVRGEIEKVRGEVEKVRGEIEKVKSDLLKWIVTALIAQASLIVALVKLL